MSEAPDPSKFRKPHVWATFVPNRTTKFKTHSALGLAKAAISSCYGGGDAQYRMVDGKRSYERPLAEAWVYEFVEDEWVERWHIPKGTFRDEHPLWKTTAKKLTTPVSEKAVNKAIASILRSASGVTGDA